MYKLNRYAIALTLVLISLQQPLACEGGKDTADHNNIQNTSKATEYFTNELDFTTNPYGLNAAIKAKENIIIVDIRSAKDYEKEHIPGAINLPMDKYKSFTGDETEFPGLKKDRINYVYCYALLCNGGKKACKKFASLGYPVKEVKGGFKEWLAQGYQVEPATGFTPH